MKFLSVGNILAIVALLWVFVLVGFVAYKEYTLNSGEEVVLKTVPVDPWDFFRGEYVVLNYEISQIDLYGVSVGNGAYFEEGDDVFVKLKKGGKYHTADGVSKQKFEGDLFIKGEVVSVYSNILNIDYGIESFFVEQGKGKEIEKNISNTDVYVSIDKNGNAVIKYLISNGEKFE